ncbi:hypothetical protein DL763_011303 [Monosporascus cannonballus]|nr:hypothetical protein DL763_011303 [Monosporascus cannonballus]
MQDNGLLSTRLARNYLGRPAQSRGARSARILSDMAAATCVRAGCDSDEGCLGDADEHALPLDDDRMHACIEPAYARETDA